MQKEYGVRKMRVLLVLIIALVLALFVRYCLGYFLGWLITTMFSVPLVQFFNSLNLNGTGVVDAIPEMMGILAVILLLLCGSSSSSR